MKLKHILATLVLVILGTVVFSGGSASAATFTVATGNDENTNNSSCALSEAIENINDGATTNADCSPTGAYGTNDTINLPTGTITLTGDLAEIESDVVIAGQGKTTSIVDGDGTYDGIYIEDIVDTFTATDFTFRDGGAFALGVCAVDVTIDQVSVENSTTGAVFACNEGSYTESVSVTDSDFNNNDNAGGTAGLFIAPESDPSCSGSLVIELTRVRANENTISDNDGGAAAGIFINPDNDCTDPFVETVTFEDVEANLNTSASAAGIALSNGGSAVTTTVGFDRVSAIGNLITGSLDGLEGAPASSGVVMLNMLNVSLTNVTASGNSANVASISNSAGSGISLVTLSTVASFEVINTTVTDNSVTGSSNVPGGLATTGISSLNTPDYMTSTPVAYTNILAANNTMDGTPATCTQAIDFGGGPIELQLDSGGGNVIGDNSCAYGLDHPTDQNNVSGLFSTLASPAYNDGFVQTVALLEGSPAINAGVDVALSQDAQLLARSQGGGVDAGAYESPFSLASSEEGDDGESGGGSTLAESGATVFGIAILSLATLSGAIGISRRSAIRFRSHL